MAKPVIALASILAGGGHNSVRKFLFGELRKQPDWEVLQFTHSKEYLDKIYNTTSMHFSQISTFSYQNIPNEIVGLTTLNLLEECVNFLNDKKPDMVITTHFLLGLHFTLAKIFAEKKSLIISSITDYGAPASSVFPYSKKIRPDYLLVFDEKTRESLQNDFAYPRENIILSGFQSLPIFHQQIENFSEKNLARAQLKKIFPEAVYQEIDPQKKTVLISAGAGAVIKKAEELINEIAKYQNYNPQLLKQYQFMVICGVNSNYFEKLTGLHQHNELWRNIFPFTWLNSEQYALLQYACDFPVLISTGFATINELIATETGPMLVYSNRGGQEIGNLEFLLENNLGLHIPSKKECVEKIFTGFTQNEKLLFTSTAKRYHKQQQILISKLPAVIAGILNSREMPPAKDTGKAKSLEKPFPVNLLPRKIERSRVIKIAIFVSTILSVFLSIFAFLGVRSFKSFKKMRKVRK